MQRRSSLLVDTRVRNGIAQWQAFALPALQDDVRRPSDLKKRGHGGEYPSIAARDLASLRKCSVSLSIVSGFIGGISCLRSRRFASRSSLTPGARLIGSTR